MQLEEDMSVVTPVIVSRLASPQRGIYLDREMYKVAPNPSEESDNYVNKVLATSQY